MAWYPGAQKLELQPESDDQPAIRPTQFIMHSIAAPWTPRRTYEYWRDSTNLESHFGLGYDGSIAQFIGTQTRADANYRANLRPDGTGAVSIETASNLDASDPWTPEQVEQLIRLGVWLHEEHGIPLRICRSWDDPGYGFHRLHAAWAQGGSTDCPGNARVKQFHTVIFPGIVARATGQSQEDDMPTPAELWAYPLTAPDGRKVSAGDVLVWSDRRHDVVYGEIVGVKAQIAGLTATVQTLAGLLGQHDDVDTDRVVAAVEQAIADAVVRVSVDVSGTPATAPKES